jgi:hypothetical protein
MCHDNYESMLSNILAAVSGDSNKISNVVVADAAKKTSAPDSRQRNGHCKVRRCEESRKEEFGG